MERRLTEGCVWVEEVGGERCECGMYMCTYVYI